MLGPCARSSRFFGCPAMRTCGRPIAIRSIAASRSSDRPNPRHPPLDPTHYLRWVCPRRGAARPRSRPGRGRRQATAPGAWPARRPQCMHTAQGRQSRSPCLLPPHSLQLTAEEHYMEAQMAFISDNLDAAKASLKRALELEPEVRCCRCPRLAGWLSAGRCALSAGEHLRSSGGRRRRSLGWRSSSLRPLRPPSPPRAAFLRPARPPPNPHAARPPAPAHLWHQSLPPSHPPARPRLHRTSSA